MNFFRSIWRSRQPKPKPLPKRILVHLEMPTLAPGLGDRPAGNIIGLELLVFCLCERLTRRGQGHCVIFRIGELNSSTISIEPKFTYSALAIIKSALDELHLLGFAEIWYTGSGCWLPYFPCDSPEGGPAQWLSAAETNRWLARYNANIRQLTAGIERSRKDGIE